MKKGKLGAILLALVLIIGLVCCVVCLEKIPRRLRRRCV